MQKPISGVFIQCATHIFDAAEVVSVVRKERLILDDFIVVTSSCGEVKKFPSTMEVPMKEAFVLANQELAQRKSEQGTSGENVVFEILPTYQGEDGEPLLMTEEEAALFHLSGSHPSEGFCGYKVFKRAIGLG